MPELPEVEVTRLSFADRIVGARVQADFRGRYDKDEEDWMGEARLSLGVLIAIR